MNICSLLPGATEIVAALGLADDLVGISHECDYPVTVRNKRVLIKPTVDPTRISSPEIDHQVRTAVAAGESLYMLDESGFTQARPDLVITQDLCDVCAVTPEQVHRAIRALPRPPEVLTLNPNCLADVIEDIERIAGATGCVTQGHVFATALRNRLDAIREKISAARHRPRVVCLEWLDPVYIGGHWVPEMVALAGGDDVLGEAGAASRVVNWDAVIAARPDILLIMPCGFAIARTKSELHRLTSRPGWTTLPAVIQNRVFAVDAAAYFSRPGPRLVGGVEILASLFHPDRVQLAAHEHAQQVTTDADGTG